MAKAPAKPKLGHGDPLNAFITTALSAGFVELAYGMLIVATAAGGLALVPQITLPEYQTFRWTLVILGTLGALYILGDVLVRFFARVANILGSKST